jgi:hypothetical protein
MPRPTLSLAVDEREGGGTPVNREEDGVAGVETDAAIEDGERRERRPEDSDAERPWLCLLWC